MFRKLYENKKKDDFRYIPVIELCNINSKLVHHYNNCNSYVIVTITQLAHIIHK